MMSDSDVGSAEAGMRERAVWGDWIWLWEGGQAGGLNRFIVRLEPPTSDGAHRGFGGFESCGLRWVEKLDGLDLGSQDGSGWGS